MALTDGPTAGMFLSGNDPFHISEGQKPQYDFSGQVYANDSFGNYAARGSIHLSPAVAPVSNFLFP